MLGCMFRCSVLITLFITCPLRAQSAPDEELTLDQCVTLALERHPLIRSAEKRHQASQARIRQVTAYPYPSIGYNSDLQPHFLDFVNSAESYLGVNQTFELPRKRAVRGRIAEEESREIETDIDLIRLEVIFQVRRAFNELLLAQEKLEYARRDAELTDNYLEKAEQKLAAGDVGRVEVLRAKVEALQAANALRAAEADAQLARARLNYHLARPKGDQIRIIGRLDVPFSDLNLEALRKEAEVSRPELKRLQFSIKRELHTQEGARLSNWPDLDFNLSSHRLENEPTTWSFTVTVPLPFLFKQRQKAEMAEAQANIGALEREADQVRNTIMLEVEEAFTNAQRARNEITLLHGQILPQAQEVYDMFLFSYQEGEIGGIELIEARRTLNESRRSYADALFEYALALAVLDRAVGRMP